MYLVPMNSCRHHLLLINNYPSYEQAELKKIKTIITWKYVWYIGFRFYVCGARIRFSSQPLYGAIDNQNVTVHLHCQLDYTYNYMKIYLKMYPLECFKKNFYWTRKMDWRWTNHLKPTHNICSTYFSAAVIKQQAAVLSCYLVSCFTEASQF